MNGDGRVGVFPGTVGDGGGRGCLGASLLHSRDPSSDPAGVGFFLLLARTSKVGIQIVILLESCSYDAN